MALSQTALDDLARKGAERGVEVRPALELVEQRLRTTVATELPLMDDAARHLVAAGGKRFRPMLVLLCGLLGGGRARDDDLIDAAVIVELVHLATLHHDDVIDGAAARRGVETVHVRWTNTVAILSGDFLLARASELSARLGTEVTALMAQTIAQLCTGQVREVQGSRLGRDHGMVPAQDARDHYLEVIKEKTASLISASCRVGGLLSKLPREGVEALGAYGHHLGMSFQLADDVLDIAGEQAESGKEPGTDLREGVHTMPVLYALEADGPESELAGLLDAPTEENVGTALDLLRAHPAMELARDDARLEAAKAKRSLRMFESDDCPQAAIEALAWLADYAASRVG